jgi:fluoride exporter
MNWPAFLSVLVGGAIGSVLRWLIGVALNPLLPALPLGTLAVNLVGGFIIGGAIGVFDHFQSLPPELRLFVTTGFCGGLTTFSAFSAETVNRFLDEQYGWSLAIIGSHVIGSLLMTWLGISMVRMLLKA